MGHFGNLTFEDFGTHIPWLVACATQTTGEVVEFGCGDYSTYTLHVLCHALSRKLTTIDSDSEWLSRYQELDSPAHSIIHTEDLTSIAPWPCGTLLIDSLRGATLRGDVLRKWRGHADIIILHDTEDPGYGYSPTLDQFKYRHDCYRLRPATTALSDTIDLSFLHLPGDMYDHG